MFPSTRALSCSLGFALIASPTLERVDFSSARAQLIERDSQIAVLTVGPGESVLDLVEYCFDGIVDKPRQLIRVRLRHGLLVEFGPFLQVSEPRHLHFVPLRIA